MRLLYGLTLLILSSLAHAWDHSAWDELLSRHVEWTRGGHASVVDYDGFARDREQLNDYLVRLQSVGKDSFKQWSGEEQLAFLINAYNAFTVELILEHRSEIDNSIKDIGGWFRGPWDIRFFSLLEGKRNLDELEHKLIRGNYEEPAVHFALNCASVGCPALRPEAYTGEKLLEQLKDARRRFLSDDMRNYYDADENELVVSPIFGWYEDDFDNAYGSLRGYFSRYAELITDDTAIQQQILEGTIGIGFGDYDWSLNTLANTPTGEQQQ